MKAAGAAGDPNKFDSAAGGASLVAKQIEGALALLLKRGWLEATPDENARIFAEIQEAVMRTGDPESRQVAIGLLEAVVIEFSPATASPMGACVYLSHITCCAIFITVLSMSI